MLCTAGKGMLRKTVFKIPKHSMQRLLIKYVYSRHFDLLLHRNLLKATGLEPTTLGITAGQQQSHLKKCHTKMVSIIVKKPVILQS